MSFKLLRPADTRLPDVLEEMFIGRALAELCLMPKGLRKFFVGECRVTTRQDYSTSSLILMNWNALIVPGSMQQEEFLYIVTAQTISHTVG
jgi:hypothetical protein